MQPPDDTSPPGTADADQLWLAVAGYLDWPPEIAEVCLELARDYPRWEVYWHAGGGVVDPEPCYRGSVRTSVLYGRAGGLYQVTATTAEHLRAQVAAADATLPDQPGPARPDPVLNRRIIAERLHWPPGALKECLALEQRFVGWSVFWNPGTLRTDPVPGFRAVRYLGSWFRRTAGAATAAELAEELERIDAEQKPPG